MRVRIARKRDGDIITTNQSGRVRRATDCERRSTKVRLLIVIGVTSNQLFAP